MLTEAKIISLDGDIAVVECKRKSACEGCHKNKDGDCAVCSLVGSNATITLRAKNRAGGKVGDIVEVSTETRRVLGYAALVFILPIAAALLGWWLGSVLGGEIISALLAAVALLLSFTGIWLYSRFSVSRRCDAVIVSVRGETKQ